MEYGPDGAGEIGPESFPCLLSLCFLRLFAAMPEVILWGKF
jgi:hypothetical protein